MLWLQKLLPHYQINKLAKKLANCYISWIKNLLIYGFMQKYAINLQEAEQSDPFAYKSFNDFFIRKLKSDVRRINFDPKIIVSPCDGYISEYGNISDNNLIQAKEKKLSLKDLLANQINSVNSQIFENGKFITIYLAPHNYHRIHMPITATLKQMIYVPGKLFSVNPIIVKKIPNIFTINERVINIFDSELGKIAIILVGAMVVGSIATQWHGEVISDLPKTIQVWDYQHLNLTFNRGNEMGLFQLGSTVIVLFENHKLDFCSNFASNQIIKMGEKILFPT